MTSTYLVSAMAAVNFSLTLSAEFDECSKLLARALLTILIACMLNGMIYTIYHVLPHGRVWSLGHEDLNDYNYEYTDAFKNGDICFICQDEFGQTLNDSLRLCAPIRLQPCAHVVGDKCFSRWIASFNDTRFAGSMRCPYCSQRISRTPQPLYRHIARLIASTIDTVRHDFRSIYFALLHFHLQQPTRTRADYDRMLQRRRRFARYERLFLRVFLWLLDARTALLMAADVLRCIDGLSHLSIGLAQLARLADDRFIEGAPGLILLIAMILVNHEVADHDETQ